MSPDSSNALWAAIRARFLADAAITNLAGDRVFDRPLDGEKFPYVQFDDTQVQPFDGLCINGAAIYLTIRVWVRDDWAGDVGRDLCAAIYESLHRQKFPLAGHTLQLMEHQSTNFRRDPDGITRQGIVTFLANTTTAA